MSSLIGAGPVNLNIPHLTANPPDKGTGPGAVVCLRAEMIHHILQVVFLISLKEGASSVLPHTHLKTRLISLPISAMGRMIRLARRSGRCRSGESELSPFFVSSVSFFFASSRFCRG